MRVGLPRDSVLCPVPSPYPIPPLRSCLFWTLPSSPTPDCPSPASLFPPLSLPSRPVLIHAPRFHVLFLRTVSPFSTALPQYPPTPSLPARPPPSACPSTASGPRRPPSRRLPSLPEPRTPTSCALPRPGRGCRATEGPETAAESGPRRPVGSG